MTRKSTLQLVEEQVQKWQVLHSEKPRKKPGPRSVTLSREPGSGGRLVAKGVAERLGMDLFHQEVIQEMAESAQVSSRLMETLDERGLSVLEDWITSLVNDRHLWPDQYMQHLLRVVATLGRHGNAVLVGRGANFILPAEACLRVRVIAPMAFRVEQVARNFDLNPEDARRRVIRTESNRRAFVRKYFYADISDPVNYHLIVNTGAMGIEQSVETVISALGRR